MPASKRSSESHSPQAKMMRLEEDEETTPGANNSSHKTEDAHERTVPPWTKKKDPPTTKEEDEEVASILHKSKQSTGQCDSDPPLKKAKLFIATSASSGTVSAQSSQSKASQKRPASTELSRTVSSESDGELSSDDCKTSLLMQTDAAGMSRCVTKHHHRANRAATESLVDQSIAIQTLEDGKLPDPLEMDHNYGRASEGSTDGSVVEETAVKETKEVNMSLITLCTHECIDNTLQPSFQATETSVIQSTHPAAEARGHGEEEPTRSNTEPGRITEHVNNRPSDNSEEHETEVSSERTSREPDSQNHNDGKKEPPPPAETSNPSSSDGTLNLRADVDLSASQSESGGLAEPVAITHSGTEPRADENYDLATGERTPDMLHTCKAEEWIKQDVTETTGVTAAPRKAVIESSPASNQTTTTTTPPNYDQELVMPGPSEESVSLAKTCGPPERADEAQVKILVTVAKTSAAKPAQSDPVEPGREETVANFYVVHPEAESPGCPSGLQAALSDGNRAVSLAEESIATPESSDEVQQVHVIQDPDDRTVSSSTEVVVTNSEEHVGRTVHVCVTVQEPEITSNLDCTTSSQLMFDMVPAEDTQPEVMQNVHTSTSSYSSVSPQLSITNPDSRQTEYESVSQCETTQETPNLVSTTTDPLPTEKTEPDGTQHLDVTPDTPRDGPDLLPDTHSEIISDCVAEEEVQPQVNLSSATPFLEDKPDLVITEATMEEEVSLNVDNDNVFPGLSSHGLDLMVVRPLISEEQDNANVESTAALVVSSTMPTESMIHYEGASMDLSISIPEPAANVENNEVVYESVAESSLTMVSTATDEQIPEQALVIMDCVGHRETPSDDSGIIYVDTRVSQHVMTDAGGKEGETVISEYVYEQMIDGYATTSATNPSVSPDILEDKEIQVAKDDNTSMSSGVPKHLTISTSDCVGDQNTAPYMEMTETKPDLSNQARENEDPDQEQNVKGISEIGASHLMTKNLEPVVSQSISVKPPQIASMSMTVPLQQASTEVSHKEFQPQNEAMVMDKHVLIASSPTDESQCIGYEGHTVHGGQTDVIAQIFTTSEVMYEAKVTNRTNLSHEISTQPLIITSERAVNEDVISSEYVAESDKNMHTTCTPVEAHEQGEKEDGGDQGNHSGGVQYAPTQHDAKEEDRFDTLAADMPSATSDGVPNFIPATKQQIQVIREEHIAGVNDIKEGCLLSNAELMDKEMTKETVVYVTSEDQRNVDEITSMEGKSQSDKQEEAGLVIDEVEANASLHSTSDNVAVSSQLEETVFVEDVPEQMETVIPSEEEAKNFQVVYEAISSPESTIDEELSVMPGSIMLPNEPKNEVVECDSAAISSTSKVKALVVPTQEADEQINGSTPACPPDSHSDMEVETMTCALTAERSDVLPIEHTNGAVNMGDAFMIASEVPEPSIPKTEVMADILEEVTSDDVTESIIEKTREMADVLEETNSYDIIEPDVQNREQTTEELVLTASNEFPKQNTQNTEESKEALVVTTRAEVLELEIQKNKGMAKVLVVATIGHIAEQNIEKAEQMEEVPMVTTTSSEVPEQNIQHTAEVADVLSPTTSNHIPEQSIQTSIMMAEAPVVATNETIAERPTQKTEEIGDVLGVTTCYNMPELNMRQAEGMGDVLVVTPCDNKPAPFVQQMERMEDEEEAVKEDIAPAESVEMQKGYALQELSQVTQISNAMASSEMPDILQEEVGDALADPENTDHMDIITQAAAASGLTTSLPDHLNSDGQMVEADHVLNVNGNSQSFASKEGEARGNMVVKSATDAVPGSLLENYIPAVPDADQQDEQSAEKHLESNDHDMENPAVSLPQMPVYENTSVDLSKGVDASSENVEGDMQILVDIELGQQVEVQDESEMDDPDLVIIEKSQLAVDVPPAEVENGDAKSPTNSTTTTTADTSSKMAQETTNKTSTLSVTPDPKAEVTVEKPKKQQMNTQARTKARLAALAEQKAAASKRAAQRQQLNLLALCEEIAEDIATDSMLLKRIEEEKMAVAAAAAAKMDALKKESSSIDVQAVTSVPPTPSGPQAPSPTVDTTDQVASIKPPTTTTTITTTAEPVQAKPVAPEPPKRRFFVSQIVVPLKAHEKKKLTRYQRLRQVELQREKMSWTRVKKLKTDQAHQMLFSDIDFDLSNPFLMPPVATPSTPVVNKPSAADTSLASASISTTSALPSTPQVPEAAVSKPDQSKTPDPSKAVTTTDPSKAVTTPDSSKVVETPDPSKVVEATPDPSNVVTTKPDQKVTPRPGRPRREAATPKGDPPKVVGSKVVPPKVTSAKGPTAKVTRSSTRKTLPAKPPPMPNGMNSQKAKSEVEYKPYRPRPKYSIEDFELDDDPPPVVQRRAMPQPRPAQHPGTSQQSISITQVRPAFQSTAQSRSTPPSKPMVSSQLASQTKLKLQGTPAGQVSSQSKPAISTPVMFKPATSTSVQSKPANSSTLQSKPVTTMASQSKPVALTISQSKPATSATGQLKPATTNTTESKPVQSKSVAAEVPLSNPVTSSISQSKPPIAAAPQPKTAIAATAPPISPVQSNLTMKKQESATIGSVPGKDLPSSLLTPQITPVGTTTSHPKADQVPKPQPGSLQEQLKVKPAGETLVLIPADPQPDVSMETLSVQPQPEPTVEHMQGREIEEEALKEDNPPHNVECQQSTGEVSLPPPSSSLPPEEKQTSSDRTVLKEEKPEVKLQPPSPLKASPPEEQAEVSTPAEKTPAQPSEHRFWKAEGNTVPLSEASLQKEVKKLKDTDKDGTQTIIDAGQKHFGAVACSVCGMLYSASNPEDETQHILFHNQFISAVKYVGWKKERILGEYPDGKIILVLPDDPKYALKKVEEIREMVDNDLGFQQVETKCPSQTKTFLFISNDKKVAGCLIAEHIQEGYRVIEDPAPEGTEREQVMFERQRAWCCSSTSEPAICGISRIWVFSMMRRQGIASRMIECLRNNFIYGSCLGKDELAFSDPTPDGKLFATRYFGTSRFLVYNFVSGTRPSEPKIAPV